ncbi:unannotated protein [freshwater metagenome]|uniref:Unannotated protein n=1 Tax=freshwater metagenome TaxID=449393 RepID=A0A6J6QI43_9ZZZZ
MDFAHAVLSGPQTEDACGILGIATPSTPAVPNACANRPPIEVLYVEFLFAGARSDIAAIFDWKVELLSFLTTRPGTTSPNPWASAYEVAMKPLIPSSGAMAKLASIRGTGDMKYLNFRACNVEALHGPVIQKGARPALNAASAATTSTEELINPVLFQSSIIFVFLRKTEL